jgi:hypothetical protein
MKRAYSQLTIKSFDDETRTIEGVASTPRPDRMEDVVEPLGAVFDLPMMMLLDHNSTEAVGHVEFAKPNKDGIPFKAKIVKFDEPGEVKDLVDKAWHLVKTRLRSFVSIGFRPLTQEVMKNGGYRFMTWEWLELSLVTIPANKDAVIFGAKSIDTAIDEIKSLDREALAARETDGRAKLRVFASALEPLGEAGLAAAAATEIPAEPQDKAASGQSVHVVKLNAPARARAPFVINKINHLG